jgi:tripartite ATP-independent transporter DctP family solute receptor
MKFRKSLIIFSSVLLSFSILLVGCGTNSTTETSSKSKIRTLKFAYDEPRDTGYGVAGDILAKKLEELSGGNLKIQQFPNAQLGQEPELLQKVRSGDIDFVLSTSANASTVAPQSAVLSLHYLFKSEDQLKKALADPEINKAYQDLIQHSVKGAHVLNLLSIGFRDVYTNKKEIKNVSDMKGLKIRVQATKTEDTLFPAYGAQTVHLAFGQVYTSLQTGVMEAAENSLDVYLKNKHYEVAPVISLTQHEAGVSGLWVSDKVWNTLSDQEKKWVQDAAIEVGKEQPAKQLELDHEAETKLKSLGIKVIDVDKTGFIKIDEQLDEQIAKELGPDAEKLFNLVRNLK